jgi:hypothetical protein
MSWIVITRRCSDCGGKVSFEVFDEKPTEDQISYFNERAGNFSCATQYIKEIEEGYNEIDNDD